MQVSLPSHSDLGQLLDEPPAPTVSIYMPTHRTGRETRQDPIRLKNLIKAADEQLAARGCDDGQRDAMLSPARDLPDDVTAPFWQNGNDALALLLRENSARCYKLPIDVPEVAFVADHFFVNPLLQYLQGDGAFYVLAASRNHVRLLNGTKHSIAEVELESLPKNLQDALNIDEYQSSLQFHSPSLTGNTGGQAIFHGHGGGEGEDRKQELLQFFHRLNDALAPFLRSTGSPLVFAGVDYLFPIFEQACDYDRIVSKPITGNPDELRPEELHEEAWKLVEPSFATARQDGAERFHLAASRGKATEDLEQIVAAAQEGRIDTLLLAESIARLQSQAEEIQRTDDRLDQQVATAMQMYSRAAVQALQTDGTVLLLPPEAMPTEAKAAAILRY